MHLLAIESFVWSPHIETSAEICIKRAETQDVGVCILEIPNLDDPDVALRLFGVFGNARRIRQVKRVLAESAVRNVAPPKLSFAEVASAAEFARTPIRSFQELIQLQFQGVNIGFGVGSSLVDLLKQETPAIEQCLAHGMIEYLHNAALVFLSADKLIKAHRPQAVLTFNGRFANARPISLAAQCNDTPVLYHEGSDHFLRYRLADKSPHDFEWWRASIAAAWGAREDPRRAEDIAVRYFERRLAGRFNEGMSHTKRQQRGTLPPLEDKRRIAFFSQSDEEYAVVDGLVHPIFANQRVCIAWLIDYFAERSDVQFLIRLHPNLLNKSSEDRDWWHGISGKNLTLIPADSSIDSYALIENVDVVLSYCSASIGIEATYLQKASIVLGDSVFSSTDAAYHPASIPAVMALLEDRALPPKPKENAYPYAYFRETYGVAFERYKPSTPYSGTIAGVRLDKYPVAVARAIGMIREMARRGRRMRRPT